MYQINMDNYNSSNHDSCRTTFAAYLLKFICRIEQKIGGLSLVETYC